MFKKLLLTLCYSLTVLPASLVLASPSASNARFVAPSSPLRTPPAAPTINWLSDYSEALEQGQETSKPIVMVFSGTDWCGWCMKLDNEILGTPEFATMASDKFIFLKLEYLRDSSKLDPQIVAQNQLLQEQYAIKGFPTVILLNGTTGQQIGSTGYRAGGGANYAQHLLAMANLNSNVNGINWQTNFAQAIDQARATTKPVLIYFEGTGWCGWCSKINQEIFDTPEFAAGAAGKFIFMKVEVPRNGHSDPQTQMQNQQLQQQFSVTGFPTVILYDAQSSQTIARTGYRAGGGAQYAEYLQQLLTNPMAK